MAISAEHNKLFTHKSSSMAIARSWSATGLPTHILIPGWVRGPSEVDLADSTLPHALGKYVKAGVLVLDDEAVFHGDGGG